MPAQGRVKAHNERLRRLLCGKASPFRTVGRQSREVDATWDFIQGHAMACPYREIRTPAIDA